MTGFDHRSACVRPARASDLDALARAQQTLAEPSPTLLHGALQNDGPVEVLVATPDDAPDDPIGYAMLVPGPEAVYLPELAVRPKHQGQGHGTALLETVRNRYGETLTLRVTVAVANEGAIRFYERHGFERRSRLADRFDSGDGLLLEWSAAG